MLNTIVAGVLDFHYRAKREMYSSHVITIFAKRVVTSDFGSIRFSDEEGGLEVLFSDSPFARRGKGNDALFLLLLLPFYSTV